MKIEQREISSRFVIWWIVASAVGGAIGLFGLGESMVIYATGEQAGWSFLELGLTAGVISGVALAAIIYVALRRDVSWAWWCLGSFAVSIIGWTAVGTVSQSIAAGEMATSGAVTAAVKGIWFGACIGVAQWLVLIRKVSGAGWWIVASIMGWSLLLAVSYPVMSAGLIGHIDTAVEVTAPGELTISGRDITILSQVGFAVFGGIAFGAQLGLMQWLVIRRNIAQARWWLLVSAVGWAFAWLVVGLVYRVLPTAMHFEFYGGFLFFGLFIGLGGAATGIPLVRLLRWSVEPEEVLGLRSLVAWLMGVGIVAAVAALALGGALATVHDEPKAPTPTEDTYSVRSDKDALDILSIDPPDGKTLQPGAAVTLTVNVKYTLDSHERAFLELRWTDNFESGVLAHSEVSAGSGQMILEGILVVPDSSMVFLTVHLSPPPSVVLEAGFTGWLDILYETVGDYPISKLQSRSTAKSPSRGFSLEDRRIDRQ